jgi:hypothetical protein
MTRGHLIVAGLAWVLLVPPIGANHRIVPNAPLADWTVAGKFASYDACFDAMSVAVFRQHGYFAFGNEGAEPQCLKADDPRLGGNAALPQR